MFFFGKKNKKAASVPGKPSREQLIANAHAAARKARAEIGEETIQKIAESFAREQEEAVKKRRAEAISKAIADVKSADRDVVIDHIRNMIRENRS